MLLNFTTGPRGVEYAVELLGIEHIVSARKLIEKLRNEGFAEATELLSKTLFLDELVPRISLVRKLKAAFFARFFLAQAASRHVPRYGRGALHQWLGERAQGRSAHESQYSD